MTQFDERLRDPLYLFYVKIGLCLGILKEGLEHFVECISIKLHQNIFTVSYFKNKPSSKKGLCRNAKFTYVNHEWISNCCHNCSELIQTVAGHCSNTFNPRRLNWRNSDCTGWTGKSGSWQIAKLFMNKGVKPSQNGPQDTDICGILNFISNCRNGIVWVSNVDYLQKVREIRNTVMHNPRMKMTEHEFMASVETMIHFLQDLERKWNSNGDFETTILRLKKVRASKFCVKYTHELELLEQKYTASEEMTSYLKDQVSFLEERNKESVSRNEEILHELATVRSERDKDKETARKLTEVLGSFKELISEDPLLHTVFEPRISKLDTTVREAIKQSLDSEDDSQEEQQEYLRNIQDCEPCYSEVFIEEQERDELQNLQSDDRGFEPHCSGESIQGEERDKLIPDHQFDETGFEPHCSGGSIQGEERDQLIPDLQSDGIRFEPHCSGESIQGEERDTLIPDHQSEETRFEPHCSGESIQGEERDKLIPDHQSDETRFEQHTAEAFIQGRERDEDCPDYQDNERRERSCCYRLLDAIGKFGFNGCRKRKKSGERNCCYRLLDALWKFALNNGRSRKLPETSPNE